MLPKIGLSRVPTVTVMLLAKAIGKKMSVFACQFKESEIFAVAKLRY